MRPWSSFKIFTKDATTILAFEPEADLAEWALDKSVLIPAFLRVFLTQPDIVQSKAALWILIDLKAMASHD